MDSTIKYDGDDSFALGMDGFTKSDKLLPGQYEAGMNLICRGGVAMTRPGSRSLLDLPAGRIQGVTLFKPTSGHPCLVFAIDGKVYFSAQPFRSYTQIPGIQFYKHSRFISWAECVKSTDYTDDGTLVPLDTPVKVLVIQDGRTRAAVWDGTTGRHLNPEKSGQEATKPGYDETIIGLWMKWSNNRLWVSRGNLVFASDIGNPLKFTEAQYLNELRAFVLAGECTGIAEVPDRSGIVCFTESTAELLQSAIQDRSLWSATPGFQSTVLTGIGCVSHRSIVKQQGLLWWWTTNGLISQDAALQQNRTSVIQIEDNEMIQSKSQLSYDISGVCGATFENFTLHGLPASDYRNTVVHVLDNGDQETPANVWPSYWTGWRPVEFASGIINSRERMFCISEDYDGVNRIWELFTQDRTDNGIPITSYLLSRTYYFGDRDWKQFGYAEVEMCGIIGSTAVMVAVAGVKGAFQRLVDKDISATNGQIYTDVRYGKGFNNMRGSRPQTRIIRTSNQPEASDGNAVSVESEFNGLIDKGFCVLVVWSGIAGVSAIRAFSHNKPEAIQGVSEDNETGEDRLLTEDGCSAMQKLSKLEAFPVFVSEATFSRISPVTGLPVSRTAKQGSVISQVDADRKSSQTAKWYVMHEIGEIL